MPAELSRHNAHPMDSKTSSSGSLPPTAGHRSSRSPQLYPEWRVSPTVVQQPPWQQLAPPIPAQSYQPDMYGPMPGTSPLGISPASRLSGADAMAWRPSHDQWPSLSPPPPPPPPPAPPPPPLPPRPPSSAGWSYVQAQPEPTARQPSLGPCLSWATPAAPSSEDGAMQQTSNPTPPPPPPPAVSVDYQTSQLLFNSNQSSKPCYSSPLDQQHQQSAPSVPPPVPGKYVETETGELLSASGPGTSLSPQTHVHHGHAHAGLVSASSNVFLQHAPVSPAMKPLESLAFGASALGAGGPSNWEHFSPSPGTLSPDVLSPESEMLPAPQLRPSQPQTTTAMGFSQQPQFAEWSAERPKPSKHTSKMLSDGTHDEQQSSPAPRTHVRRGAGETENERYKSDSSAVSAGEPTDDIEAVMEAWARPISPQTQSSASEHDKRASYVPARVEGCDEKVSAQDRQRSGLPETAASQPAFPLPRPGETPSTSRTATLVADPYEDLDPWAKSSLARYVAMLRKEAVADSDAERFKLFTSFMTKETKLREILYNITESEPKKDFEKATHHQSAETVSQAHPADSQLRTVSQPSSVNGKGSKSGDDVDAGARLILSEETSTPTTADSRPNDSVASSFIAGAAAVAGPSERESPKHMDDGQHLQGEDGSTHRPKPVSLSPLTSDPPQPIYTPFRYTEGPQRGSDKLNFDRPAYQAYSALRQASAESGRVMSIMATSEAETETDADTNAEAGRQKTSTIAYSSPNLSEVQHDETFVGLIREKSVAYHHRQNTPGRVPLSSSTSQQTAPGKDTSELQEVVGALSKLSQAWSPAEAPDGFTKEIAKYADDFTYVQQTVDLWEKAAKSRRGKLEAERIQRQEESEENIDELFNEKQIGYADINILEEEFRQTEARTQLGEERKELDDFVEHVFNPLDRRLKSEIAALKSHYERGLAELDAKPAQHNESIRQQQHCLSRAMKVVVEIHRKLELRYQKRLEIALDRERRRKRAERRPLVFMGNSAALKQLDGDFDRMEKQNLLEAAKDRDERANRLMDSFDGAIIRGLGGNQRQLDDISGKVKQLSDCVALLWPEAEAAGQESEPGQLDLGGGGSGGADDLEATLKSVSTTVAFLGADSESMLDSFGVADSMLNDADYSLSLAEARLTGGADDCGDDDDDDDDTCRRLDEEKRKEDVKIKADLRLKIESVREAPAQLALQIDRLLSRASSYRPRPAHARQQETDPAATSHPIDVLFPGPRPASTGTNSVPSESRHGDESGHQERLKRALEQAKKRNAGKNAQGSRRLT